MQESLADIVGYMLNHAYVYVAPSEIDQAVFSAWESGHCARNERQTSPPLDQCH